MRKKLKSKVGARKTLLKYAMNAEGRVLKAVNGA